jgi:hypothetical protein
MTRVPKLPSVAMGAALLALLLGFPLRSAAQARVLIAPSASAGLAFDDNLFSTPDQQALTDQILRVTPGLSASRETARSYWFGGYSFDAERYQEHPILTTPMARQTAGGLVRVATSPRTAFTLAGGYDSTNTPSELNVTTALFTGRAKAWRWRAAPEVQHALSPASTVIASYDVTSDTLQDERIVTHAGRLALVHATGVRDEFRFEPFVREFIFNTGALAVGGGMVGWTHRITRFTSLKLQGGPRFVEKSDVVKPELNLALERRTEYSEWSVSYERSMTTAIGFNAVVDTERLLARTGYHHPAVVDFTLEGGVFSNRYTTTTRAYRVGVDLTRALGPALAISLGYSLNLQNGLFNPLTFLSDAEVGTAGLNLPLLTSPATTNVPLRRNVFAVRLVVAPTIKPMRTPPENKPGPGAKTPEGNR